jgi:hypothetical protein
MMNIYNEVETMVLIDAVAVIIIIIIIIKGGVVPVLN